MYKKLYLNGNIEYMCRYYVYAYCNTNDDWFHNVTIGEYSFDFKNKPFYIGKGCTNRINYKDKKHLEVLERLTLPHTKVKLIEGLNNQDSHYIESYLITHFQKASDGGILLNKSGGIHLPTKGILTELNIDLNKFILTLKALNSSKTRAECAKKLAISERTLYRLIDDYDLSYDRVCGEWAQTS